MVTSVRSSVNKSCHVGLTSRIISHFEQPKGLYKIKGSMHVGLNGDTARFNMFVGTCVDLC